MSSSHIHNLDQEEIPASPGGVSRSKLGMVYPDNQDSQMHASHELYSLILSPASPKMRRHEHDAESQTRRVSLRRLVATDALKEAIHSIVSVSKGAVENHAGNLESPTRKSPVDRLHIDTNVKVMKTIPPLRINDDLIPISHNESTLDVVLEKKPDTKYPTRPRHTLLEQARLISRRSLPIIQLSLHNPLNAIEDVNIAKSTSINSIVSALCRPGNGDGGIPLSAASQTRSFNTLEISHAMHLLEAYVSVSSLENLTAPRESSKSYFEYPGFRASEMQTIKDLKGQDIDVASAILRNLKEAKNSVNVSIGFMLNNHYQKQKQNLSSFTNWQYDVGKSGKNMPSVPKTKLDQRSKSWPTLDTITPSLDTFTSRLIAVSETIVATSIETLINTSIALSFINLLHDMLYEQRQTILGSSQITQWTIQLIYILAPLARLIDALVLFN